MPKAVLAAMGGLPRSGGSSPAPKTNCCGIDGSATAAGARWVAPGPAARCSGAFGPRWSLPERWPAAPVLGFRAWFHGLVLGPRLAIFDVEKSPVTLSSSLTRRCGRLVVQFSACAASRTCEVHAASPHAGARLASFPPASHWLGIGAELRFCRECALLVHPQVLKVAATPGPGQISLLDKNKHTRGQTTTGQGPKRRKRPPPRGPRPGGAPRPGTRCPMLHAARLAPSGG